MKQVRESNQNVLSSISSINYSILCNQREFFNEMVVREVLQVRTQKFFIFSMNTVERYNCLYMFVKAVIQKLIPNDVLCSLS